MKKFTELIKDKDLINDKTLIKDEDLIYLENQMKICSYWRDYVINESGRYKYTDQEKLVEFISINFIKNKQTLFNKNELTKFNNIFFNELELIPKEMNDEAEYRASESNFDNNELDVIKIYLRKDIVNNISKVMKSVMHELTHARQHFTRLSKNLTSLSELTNTNSRYSKTLNNYNNVEHPGEEFCKFILNRLDKLEQSAFISELHIEYSANLIKDISESDPWQEYITVRDTMENLKTFPNNVKDEFLSYYNKYHNNSNLSFNKVYKLLHNKVDKVLDKFEKLVEKICKQKTSKEINEVKHINRNFINLLNGLYL